jgi:hypothetical protein
MRRKADGKCGPTFLGILNALKIAAATVCFALVDFRGLQFGRQIV